MKVPFALPELGNEEIDFSDMINNAEGIVKIINAIVKTTESK